MDVDGLELRQARPDDYEAVAAFTRDTWRDRGTSDYIPDIYHDWIAGDEKRTVVAADGDDIAGIAQCVLLSEYEAWGQGMRVNPAYRGRGVAEAMTHDLFDWAREQGASTVRIMVFSWNGAGLGNARYCGYEPATEFRWAHPEPDADAAPELEVTDDVNAGWRFWRDSEACQKLRGLALNFEESWSLTELTRDDFRRAADADGLFVVQDDGTKGMAVHNRTYDRPADDDEEAETHHWAEYAVGAWADEDAARSLFDAIAADAAARGADKTRLLIPETVEYVSDTALARVSFSEEPDFVLAADLTSAYRT